MGGSTSQLDGLLWCPDVKVDSGRHKQSHHLGVLYVAGYARACGHHVKTVLSGHDVGAVAALAKQGRPRVVGISVSSGMGSNLTLAADLCRRVKQADPKVRTVLGGLTPTVFHREILAHYTEVDIVVRREGEHAFSEILADRDRNDIAGIAFRDDVGTVMQTAPRPALDDLDTLPHALALETGETATTEVGGPLGSIRYERPDRSASLMTARGCDGVCTFCLNPKYYGPVRARSIRDVADEMRTLDRQGVRFLRICDANFAYDVDRVREFCAAIKPLDMRWSCWQRADMVDADAYRRMRDAGCLVTTIGVESFDDEIRNDAYRKGVSREHLSEALKAASGAGLDVTAEVIIGHPLENAERVRQGLAQAKALLKYVDYVNVSLLTIKPGTALWRKYMADLPAATQRRLWLRSLHRSVPVWRMGKGHSEEEIRRWMDDYVRSVYHNGRHLLRQCLRIAARRKRVVWINRTSIGGHVFRKVVGKVGRILRGGPKR